MKPASSFQTVRDLLIKTMQSRLKTIKADDYAVLKGDGYIQLQINSKLSRIMFSNPIPILNDVIKTVGYFVADYTVDKTEHILNLEPFFGKKVHVPQYIYHATDVRKEDAILKKGLLPHKGTRAGFLYPPRTYFYISSDVKKIKAMLNCISNYSGSKQKPLVVFKIDTTKVTGDFYFDTADKDKLSVWTYSEIKPRAISVFDTIK